MPHTRCCMCLTSECVIVCVCVTPCHCLYLVFYAQIELPDYSTDDIMRRRLISAANFGLGGFLIA